MNPSTTISFQLHSLVYAIDKLASDVLRRHTDINFSQFLIILCAYQNPGQTQKFAADWLQITEASVSYMVKKMIHEEYLRIEQDVSDSRAKKIYATQTGIDAIDKLYPLLEQALAPNLTILDAQEREILTRGVGKLITSIHRCNERNK